MPELPEVETMRRGVMKIAGATIEKAARTPCRKKPISISPRVDRLNQRVAGQTIASVDRLGKRVVLRLASNDRIIFEPRMTGIVLVGQPPNDEHLRFELLLTGCKSERLLFWDRRGLGKITLLSAQQYEDKLSDGSLAQMPYQLTLMNFAPGANRQKEKLKLHCSIKSLLPELAICTRRKFCTWQVSIRGPDAIDSRSVNGWQFMNACFRC